MIRVNQNSKKSPYFEILSADQIFSVHSASLEILEKTGMKVNNQEALDILHVGGAYIEVDYRVKIPPAMVEQALKTAPSRILVTGRCGRGTVLLERDVVNYA